MINAFEAIRAADKNIGSTIPITIKNEIQSLIQKEINKGKRESIYPVSKENIKFIPEIIKWLIFLSYNAYKGWWKNEIRIGWFYHEGMGF